ncbi:hypothetical protein [Streptomyces sp. Midd1]|uniref:hypothetical protein n=1 Tax=Streptomyces sp. Midd3 TaxID=3161191 RepID=UPI0034DB2C95
MYPEHPNTSHPRAAVEVHQPIPLTPAVAAPAPVVAMQPGSVPAVASIVLPDGRIVTGYAINPVQPEPIVPKPPVSRAAVNIALGGFGFAAVCGGLILLTTFIAALTALITQLIILAAVIFGGWIAVQIFSASGPKQGTTTVNIRKAVFKRNHFRG